MANELDELTGPINPAGNWASEPITIGDQTFTNDPNRGWIDRKTKLPADKALIKLLDSLELKPVEKKLRVKIDKKVEPVTINGQKFVYDGNALAWIDEKTKVKAADSLQKTLNGVVKVAAFGETADEVEKAFGTIGQIAKTNVKVKTPKLPRGNRARPSKLTASKKPVAQKTNQSKLINPIIANMVSILASIDDTIKQQLEQKKQLDRQNAEQADENKLESNNALANVEKEHATRIKTKNVLLAGAGGLLLMQYFDPIMTLVTDVGEVVYDMAKYTFDAMNTMADWLGWFNGKPDAETPPTGPGAPAPQPFEAEPYKAPPSDYTKPSTGPLKEGAKPTVKPTGPGPVPDAYKPTGKPIPMGMPLKQGDKQVDPAAFKKDATAAPAAPMRVFPLDVMRETSDQGMRRAPAGKNKGKLTYHTGVDYGPPKPGGADGTPVKAAASGTVSFAKFAMANSGYGGYGNAVVIQHTDGTTQALYGHLSALNVKEGDVVKAGQIIGAMGKTGLHSGTHLHFQINKAGATHHKEGLLNTKAWLRGATVGATIPAARGATIASQVSTGVDTTVKAVQNALNTPLETTTATKIASMNAVASAETIRKSAIEKTADEVGAVQPYVPPVVVVSAPNLNEGNPGYGIKTPAMADDKKILANYLIYMNVLPAEPVYQGIML
jgi:murein DD-endopeptidase MepM/ murein hydrolase activator NlpD